MPDNTYLLIYTISPFLMSILVEMFSPVVLLALSRVVNQKIDQQYEKNQQTENLKNFFGDLNGFTVDGVSTILGFMITLATAVSIPYVRQQTSLGFTLLIVLVVFLILFIFYFILVDPIRHSRWKKGLYNWTVFPAVIANVFFIFLFMM